MSLPASYLCSRCQSVITLGDEPRYHCPSCAAEDLTVLLDYERIGATTDPEHVSLSPDRSLWRYEPLLPVAVPPASAGPLRELGCTPLFAAERAARRLGLRWLWIKDDGRLPTGSLKDRASAVVAMRALELGVERIVAASTGNAGVAIAAMAQAAGLRAVVLVPATAPPAKIAQLQVFGAELWLVRGSYDDAFALSRQASRELGWYCRNTAYNPFTVEGKKTVAFEVCEQLGNRLEQRAGRWRAPDRIYLSVGDGNILAGVHKGLDELLTLGWIERMPRLFGVQAEGSAAVARAFARGDDHVEPVTARTLADSIAADSPADGWRALRAVRRSGGGMLTVSDAAILEAIVALGRDATVFAEPAAAAAYAGLLAHLGSSDGPRPDEHVLVLVTGNGLKDVAAATRATGAAPTIDPSMEALTKAIAERAGSSPNPSEQRA